MRIDPHAHSSRSDGTDAPAALMVAAARAGLDVVGLTDHDTIAGWDEAADAVPGTGVSLLRGAEISCAADGITLHLLAYLFDPADTALAAALARVRDSRGERARRMVERLASDYPITWPDVVERAGDAVSVGRPHIADALVAAGSPYYVHHWALDPVEACALVRRAGGVPVAAHPRASRRQRRLVPDATFAAMAEAGLAALEVDHRDHDAAGRAAARALAAELGLGMSGSSDYHGEGKPNRLGENLMPPDLLARIVDEGALPVVSA